ncbi:MAG: tetratricopeptide repeat protein [Gammaproteobacteria bacterium]|jgi:tetratricopeptide (TPR) repeat protein
MMRIFRLSVLSLVCGLLPMVAWSVDAEQAAQFYQTEQWSQAATAYEAIVREQPTNPQAHYRLAVALRHLGRFDEAGGQLDQAQANGTPAGFVEMERARLAAAAGDREGAVAALQRAAAAGFPNPSALTDDPLLSDLSDVAGYTASLDRIRRNQAPCLVDPVFRQFDFWIGDWEVKGGDGTVFGRNSISSEEQGCVLVERWTGAGGNTGQSINYYDGIAREWVQVWNGLGIQIHMRGGLSDGSMILVGDILYLASGDRRAFRGTWTPLDGGVVRQFFEESADDGETWSTWFEGFYHPSRPAAPTLQGS